MIMPSRKKSFIDRARAALPGKRRSRGTAARSGLISLGAVAGVTALSAVVSAIRQRQGEEGQDDRS